jgi:hypothetical protein
MYRLTTNAHVAYDTGARQTTRRSSRKVVTQCWIDAIANATATADMT